MTRVLRPLPIVAVAVLLLTAGCVSFLIDSPDLRFKDQTENNGFSYVATDSRTMNAGAAVYVSDINGDHWPDVLVLGGVVDPKTNSQGPALFLNTGGGFRLSDRLPQKKFENETINAAHFFDYDNDGLDDLLLLPVNSEPILLHNQEGVFEVRDVGFNIILDIPMGATSADYDQDGDLDVFVYQNGDWQNTTPMGYQKPGGNLDGDNGNPNVLFENTDDGFRRATNASLTGNRWSLAASFVDLTGDGWPDIHVANDYNSDYVFVNQHDGTFRQHSPGSATDRNGMSSEVVDVNGDGRPDIFVTNIYFNESHIDSGYAQNYLRNVLGKRAEGNNLLVNEGGGRFTDQAETYGVVRGGWGWAVVIDDFDNDGYFDIVQATQEYSRTFLVEAFNTTTFPTYYQYPAVWRGNGGEFIQFNGSAVGFKRSNTRGLATLDFDRDGDRDLIMTQWSEGSYRLYENTGADGSWLDIRVVGNRTQTPIGARVYVSIGETTRMQILNAKSDYLSQDSRVLHFGLGNMDEVDRVKVVWPDGTTRRYTDIEVNQLVVVSIDGNINRGVLDDQ